MKNSLLSPTADLVCFGGLSLAIAAAFWLFPATRGVSGTAFWALNLLFSAPHFLASYRVLYGGKGPWRTHPGVAWALPLGLAAFLGWAVFAADAAWMRAAAQLTLFLLHWHYLKQAYGVALWAGNRGARPSEISRQILLGTCLAIGAGGYLSAQAAPQTMKAFGLFLKPFPLPEGVDGVSRYLGLGAFALFGAWLIADTLRDNFRLEQKALRFRAVVPVAALWTWMDPRFDGTPLKLLLPVFHGLQYFPFPARLFMSESRDGYARLAVFAAIGAGAGYLWFTGIPQWLSGVVPPAKGERVFAFFTIFVNIHHYFIDAVVWRFRDPATRARLELRSPARSSPEHNSSSSLSRRRAERRR